jgi:glutathione S-transferase
MGQSRKPTVFGAPYSVYVRSVRLTLEEKAVDYDLVPVDIFAAGGPPREQVARHPFGKIPAFEHDSFRLYEAGAIARYIDEAFAGVPLPVRAFHFAELRSSEWARATGRDQ